MAAGLFNPIIGKVMTRAWKSDLLYPALHEFYPRVERILNKRFFHSIPLYRPFTTIFEQNEWMAQSADPLFKEYIEAIFLKPTFGEEVVDPFGGLLLKNCGYLDVPAFIDATRSLLINQNAYIEERFDATDLKHTDIGFEYQNIHAHKVVFCGGMEDKQTEFFSWLPLRPLKGETLEIKFQSPLKRMYNKGVYLAPMGENSYKVGATYNPKDLEKTITMAGREELVTNLDGLITKPYEIISQEWGFRPCAGDRKPYIGQHPTIKNLFVFNGLGTKGVSLSPYFSNQLADFLEGKGEIDSEASIARIRRPTFG